MKKLCSILILLVILMAAASPALADAYSDAIDSMEHWTTGLHSGQRRFNILAVDDATNMPLKGVSVSAHRDKYVVTPYIFEFGTYTDNGTTNQKGVYTLDYISVSAIYNLPDLVLRVTKVPDGYDLPDGLIRLNFSYSILGTVTPKGVKFPSWAILRSKKNYGGLFDLVETYPTVWVEIRLHKSPVSNVRFYSDDTSLNPTFKNERTGEVYPLTVREDPLNGKKYYTPGCNIPAGDYTLDGYNHASSQATFTVEYSDQIAYGTVVNRDSVHGVGFHYIGRFVPEDMDDPNLEYYTRAFPNGLPDDYDMLDHYDHYFQLTSTTEQVKAEVRWMDRENKDGIRPGSVTVELLKKSGDEWVSAANPQTVSQWTTNDLEPGVGIGKVTFYIERDPNAEYRVSVTSGTRDEKKKDLITFENDSLYRETYKDSSTTPSVILTAMKTFSVEKKWDIDIENLDKPESTTAILQKGSLDKKEIIKYSGAVDSVELNEDGDWKGTLVGERYAYTGKPEIGPIVWLTENVFRVREAKIAELKGVLKKKIDSLEDEALSKLPLPGWMKDWVKSEFLPNGKKIEQDAYNWVYEHANDINGELGELLKDYLKDDVPDEGGYITLSVPERMSIVRAKTISEHDTTYQVKYSVEGDKTTITNVPVVDITMWKQWLGDEESRPDSVYLMLASKFDDDFQEMAGEMDIPLVTQYTPVFDPVDGDMIELLGLIKIPIAIGKASANDDDDDDEDKKPDWTTHFIVKKYGESGIPQTFKGSELVSGIIGETAEALFGKWGLILEYIAGNPIQGFYSLSSIAVEVPELVGTIAGALGHDELKGMHSIIVNYKPGPNDGDGSGVEHTIGGRKYWKGDLDHKEKRPSEIQIQIYKQKENGEKGDKIGTATAKAANDWVWFFTNKEIEQDETYIIEETPVEGYETKIDGYDITNTYTGAKENAKSVKVEVIKEWVKEEQGAEIPESVNISLYRNGEKIEDAAIKPNRWDYTFTTKLDYADEQGKPYTYEIKEEASDIYTLISSSSEKRENGNEVTYTFWLKNKVFKKTEGGAKTSLTVKKRWQNDEVETRPSGVKIHLLADGAIAAEHTLTADEGWIYTFKDIPAQKGGQTVNYTVSEDTPKNYTSEIGNVTKGSSGFNCIITNTLKNTTVRVRKEWDDKGHENERPNSVTLTLKQNGKAIKDVTLTQANNWTSGDLKVPYCDENGTVYQYIIVEKNPGKNYQFRMSRSTSGDRTTLTAKNTYVDKKKNVQINVQKKWEEADGVQREHKPVSVAIYGDDVLKGTLELSANTSKPWSASKTMPRYRADGITDITYTFKEVNTEDGYTSKILTSRETSGGMLTYNCEVTNTRKTAKTLEFKLPVEKKVTGSNNSSLWENEVFNFELTPAVGFPAPTHSILSITGAGRAEYTICFDKTGEYIYTLRELQGTNEAIDYDTPGRTIRIQVREDSNGKLSATCLVGTEKSDKVVFENTIDEDKIVKHNIDFTKNVWGRDRIESEKVDFTFTLTPTGDTPKPQTNTITIRDSGTGSFPLVFNKEGKYTYKLKEKAADNPYYTYDDTVYTVTVDVAKGNDGTLTASQTVTANGKAVNKIVFKNVFNKPGDVSVILPVEKKILGPARTEAEKEIFWFTVIDDDGNDSTLSVLDEDTAYYAATFYNTSGKHLEYHYKLTEVPDNLPNSNYTYDETEYYITVVVDDINVSWTATTKDGKAVDKLVFTNVYHKPDSVTVVLPVEKKIKGDPRTKYEEEFFTFLLTEVTDNGYGQSEGDIVLDEGTSYFALSFGKPGTYRYKLTEEQDENPYYTYDAKAYDITIVVDENLHATWTATADGKTVTKLVFENEFHKPDSVIVPLRVRKVIDGPSRTPREEDFFTFWLTDENGQSEGDVVLDEGTSHFSLYFTQPDTYHYTLTEEQGDNPYYTYDKTKYTIIVDVKRGADGKLTASWTATANNGKAVDELVFTNQFHRQDAVNVVLPVEKKIIGASRTPLEQEFFTFRLTNMDDKTYESDIVLDEGTAYFGLFYTQPGIYHYMLTEEHGDNPDYIYDQTKYMITVDVTANDGKLTASWTATANGQSVTNLVFKNKIRQSSEATVVLPVKKKINGPARTASEQDFFTFLMTEVKGNGYGQTEGDVVLDEGTAYFTKLYGTPGTYTYELKEKQGSNPYYTYDKTKYTIVVDVKRSADGKLTASWTATASNGKAVDELVFTNVFHDQAVANVVLPVEKQIIGPARTASEKEFFTFRLTEVKDGVDGVSEGDVVFDEGTAYFSLFFSEPGRYTYKLTEDQEDSPYYTYDSTEYEIVIDVARVNGNLTASWTANGKPAEKLVFTNQFQRPGEVQVILPVRKTISGPARTEAEKEVFYFLLSDDTSSSTGAILDEDTAYFGLYFGKTGTYKYTLKELPGIKSTGYSYDQTVYEIIVNVTKGADEKLTASWTANGRTVDEIVFNNEFQRSDDVILSLPVEKKVYGPARTNAEKEIFSFVLTDMENGSETVGDVLDEGTIYFHLYRNTPGEYLYTLTELREDPNPNYIYDETRYLVRVRVEKGADGKLTASWTATTNGNVVDKLVFENIFQRPKSVTLVLPVEKRIYGPERSETEKQIFYFLLSDNKSGANSSAYVLDEGTAKVAMSFTAPGEYTYTLRELAGNNPNYTYDTKVYTITVEVESVNGELIANWTAEANGRAAKELFFENVFQQSESVTVVLPVEKRIYGPTRKEEEKEIFAFLLTDKNGASTSSFVIDNGTAKFDLVFNKSGKYEYTLTEMTGGNPYYTYDDTEYKISIKVERVNGKLTANWIATANGKETENLVFINRLRRTDKAIEVLVPITKIVTGDPRTSSEKETFYFQMTPVDKAPAPYESSVTLRDAGTTEFVVAFDAPGQYQYTLAEIPGSNAAYRYDSARYTIQINVSKDLSSATWTAKKNNETVESIIFENAYKKSPYVWSFTKLWSGDHGDSIEWTMYNQAGVPVYKEFSKQVVSGNEWRYSALQSGPDDYYIIENVPAGYTVTYVNVGEHAGVTDRCYNGGTIINKAIPQTGDNSHPILYAIALMMSLGYIMYAKRRRS